MKKTSNLKTVKGAQRGQAIYAPFVGASPQSGSTILRAFSLPNICPPGPLRCQLALPIVPRYARWQTRKRRHICRYNDRDDKKGGLSVTFLLALPRSFVVAPPGQSSQYMPGGASQERDAPPGPQYMPKGPSLSGQTIYAQRAERNVF